jgi:hypothetical protein
MNITDQVAPDALQSRYGKTVSLRIKDKDLLDKIERLPRGVLSSICKQALIQYFEDAAGADHEQQ